MIENEVVGEYEDTHFEKAHKLYQSLCKTERRHVWLSFSYNKR
jgi:hypothetical protein